MEQLMSHMPPTFGILCLALALTASEKRKDITSSDDMRVTVYSSYRIF